MNNKLRPALVVVALAAVLAIGAYALTRSRTSPVKADGVERPVGALTSPDFQSVFFSVNGDTEFHVVQTFLDASTTLVSFVNPFGTTVTSTVELARLDITGVATTTFTVSCGAAVGPASAPSYVILSSGNVNTSTKGVLSNNLTAALGGVADGGTVHKVALTPQYPYFVCNATEQIAGGLTNLANTLDGKATIVVTRTR